MAVMCHTVVFAQMAKGLPGDEQGQLRFAFAPGTGRTARMIRLPYLQTIAIP